MKATATLPLLSPAVASFEVSFSSADEAAAFAAAAGLEGVTVVDQTSGAARLPALVGALVLGGLFALIGTQGLNAMLGLPRLEVLFSVPAGAAAMLFTLAGMGIGLLVGVLISLEPGAAVERRVRVPHGDRRALARLAREFGGEVR